MRVSVVIPAYNRAAIVPRAMQSVLEQTHGAHDPDALELVVVDDGSTDDTAAVVRGFNDPRIVYIRQDNRGVSAARNAGGAAATGELIVFLDSDDQLVPDAVARYAAHAPGNDLVVAGVIKVSPDFLRWRTVAPDRDRVRAAGFSALSAGGFAIRRSAFAECGGYDEELRYSENTELAWRLRARLLREHRIEVIEAPLAIVYNQSERGHDQSRYDASVRILERRSYELETDPANTRAQRAFRANYLAIGAVSAARLGKRRAAVALATRAVANDPFTAGRYRALLSVGRRVVSSEPTRPARSRKHIPKAASGDAPAQPRPAGLVHAVIVTYARPERLQRTMSKLPVDDLASVTIVDNAPSPESRAVSELAMPTLAAEYLPLADNGGPAGALAIGIAHVLSTCSDTDWLLVVNDDGVPGGDGAIRRLRDFGEWLVAHGAPVGAVGLTGARFDRRTGRLHRPADYELYGPVTVDYVAGNQALMIRAGAARVAGTFDPELFFGFEELDCCLRLQRAGFAIFADGPSLRAERDRYGRLGDDVGPATRPTNAWRRYYSVRNRIVVMRRYSTTRHALTVTLQELGGRPLADLRKRRRPWLALVAAGTRGCADAWRGRLGRRVEPRDN